MLKKLFLSPSLDKKVANHSDKSSTPGVLDKSIDLVSKYYSLVEQKNLRYDASQLNVVQHLQELMECVQLQEKYQQRFFTHKFSGKTSAIQCKHLYIYGGVGHGKSMLMDLFFANCPIKHKRRVHFHAFMQEVYDFLHRRKRDHQNDVMLALSKQISKSSLLLCFDEFQVTDIADAMIMERLFRYLFEQGVMVVMTSIRHPADLYQGGLLKEQFLPFVDLLLVKSQIIELNGKVDYRFLCPNSQEKRYYYPLNTQAEEFIQATFKQHSHCDNLKAGSIPIFGREIALTAVNGNVLLTSFSELCIQSLGAADYLKIAAQFNTVIMASIPRLSADLFDEAKRFETLIDALYEHKVMFICSAEVSPVELYKKGEGAFEFQRTVSRLMEMQSVNYCQQTAEMQL